MTKFTKENLIKESGGYITYQPPSGKYKDRKVVARFKYSLPSGTFMTILRKKFTVEEYFQRIENGETPVTIAESKGYITPHIKREMKKKGYPLTIEGKKQFIADQVAMWR